MAKNKYDKKNVVESTDDIKEVNSEETTSILAAESGEVIETEEDIVKPEADNESDGADTEEEKEVIVVKEEVVHEEETQDEVNEEEEDTEEIVSDNLNFKVMGDMNIHAYHDYIDEINTVNPSLNLTTSQINQDLALKKRVRSLSSYRTIEEELMSKRDYYQVYNNEGKAFPDETDLWMLKSPQSDVNLDLDQVRKLIAAGFGLTNNRTKDIIKKRNVEEYIAKWNKNGTESILGRGSY